MAQQPPGGPQFSPDRKWWWDGTQWVPASQAPPQPPEPQPPPSKGSAGNSRTALFIGIGVGVVVLMVTGICGAALGSSSSLKPAAVSVATSPTAAPTTVPTTAPKATAAPTAAAPTRDGSCAPQPCAYDNYGWIVVVSDVKYDSPGGSFSQPESGNVFVTLNVTFTNRLDQEQHANPTQFVLLDGAGVKHTWRPFLDGPWASWQAVNVVKGGSFGPKCLSFEAAASKPTGLILVWTPSFLGGGYQINLS